MRKERKSGTKASEDEGEMSINPVVERVGSGGGTSPLDKLKEIMTN